MVNAMHTCTSCQAQMLEYLYDLLDAAERQAVQNHLDACPACQAELARAGEQRRLLAAAARMEFPEVRFTPPVGTPQAAAPAVVPMPLPVKKTRPWRRWAAAAAILLALGGVAAPGVWMERDYSHANRVVAEKQAVASAAREQMQDAARRMQDLPREEQSKVDEARDALRAASSNWPWSVRRRSPPVPGDV